MSLYKEAIIELDKNNIIKEFYRFQGANSYEHFNLKESQYNENTKDNYLYISNSLKHHEYFTLKRIKQLLNTILKEESLPIISNNNLREYETYLKIRRLLLYNPRVVDLYSIKLVTNKKMEKLLKENCTKQEIKKSIQGVEKVDNRVYGGGYGLSKEWKELLYLLTYFNSFHTIGRKDIIQIINNMRINKKISHKDNIDFILNNPENYKLLLSPKIESNFTKYDIMNCMEEIIESGNYLEDSEFGTNPNKVIKDVIEDYERGKEKVLTIFDKYYRSK